jgi:predicted nucleotide-binding protein
MIVDERILNQIDELIRLGQDVLGTQRSPGANVIGDDRVDAEAAKHWATRTQSLLSRVFGETSSYYKNFVELTSKYITFTPAKQAFGVLRAAREDYAGGSLIELRNLITADMKRNPRKIFVVHGRNEDLRRSLFAFLRAIGLNPIEWSEAVRLTGKPAPYIGEILEAAFNDAQAVVVLLTPDDEAKLRKELLQPNDPDYERYPTGQARPNVIFEAGMSFARHAERTILIEVGELRPFSDVAGRHTLRLNNSPEKRMELVERLRIAGCETATEGKSDWLNEGDFEVPLVKKATATRSNNTKLVSADLQENRNRKELVANQGEQLTDFDETTHKILKIFFLQSDDVSVEQVAHQVAVEQPMVKYHFTCFMRRASLSKRELESKLLLKHRLQCSALPPKGENTS